MTGEGEALVAMGRPVRGVGPKVGAARGRVPFAEQSYEILRDSAAARPFFCIGPRWSAVLRAFVPAAPREVEKLRVFRLRSPVFSSFARAFFVRWPGRPLRGGEVCRPSRARIAHTSAVFQFLPSPLHLTPTTHSYTSGCV